MPVWLLSLFPVLSDLLKRIVPDPAAQAQAQLELQKVLNEAAAAQAKADADKIESSSKVIVAEASSGNWMAVNWRPCLMFLFMGLIANQFFVVPILKMFGLHIEIPLLPDECWNLLEIGVGGYVIGRTGERMITTHAQGKLAVAKAQLNEKVLADKLRNSIYKKGMTKEQWEAEIAAHEAASEG